MVRFLRVLRGPARLHVAVLISLVGVAGIAGCEPAAPQELPRGWGLGTEGRACQLLDYAAVQAALGTAFDRAGGASEGTTLACVLTIGEHEYPDLTLVATPSSADELIFTAIVRPSGADPVKKLGRIAYVLRRPAGEVDGIAHGPGVEIGWLSDAGWLMVLRYTFEADAERERITEVSRGLVSLARQIDDSLAGAETPQPTGSSPTPQPTGRSPSPS